MNVAQQVAALEATAHAKKQQMQSIVQVSTDEQRSLDTAEGEAFDTLKGECEALERDLVRLRYLERVAAESAEPVQPSEVAKSSAAGVLNALQLKRPKVKLAPGIAFARYTRCLGLSHIYKQNPVDIARNLYPEDEGIQTLLKAAVPAANTLNNDWAGNLVAAESGVVADFLEYLRPQTILGKFGTNGIPALNEIPFRTAVITQTSGGNAQWVGEGKPKPLTRWAYGRTTLEPRKVAAIAVATMELLKSSNPKADTKLREELARCVTERIDIDFIDPGKAEVTGVSPASILNAATPIPSSGSDAEDIRADFMALVNTFLAGNNPLSTGVWILSSGTAMALSLMQNPLGQTIFPGIGMSGGVLFGLPAIVSEYMLRDTEGAIVALANARDIFYADEDGLEIRVSGEASLEMDDAPTNASAETPVETTLVSMFQTNSLAFLCERTVNWALAREDAVAYLTGVTWGQAS